jgi:hypothetical protein
VVACAKPLYEEVKEVSGDEVEFDLNLDSTYSTYGVSVALRYSYGLGGASDRVTAELISPTGKTYSDARYLSSKERGKAGSMVMNIGFSNVEQEGGTFKLKISKEKGKTKLKKATLKVYPPKEG